LPPFEAIESNFKTTDLILPEGFTYTVLFSEDDDVTRADGKKFPAKGNHDLSIFIPNKENPNTKGTLYISHETKYVNHDLGDGGGATIFNIEKVNGNWQVIGDFNHVDFSGVGYTNRNCGGSLTPNGTIFTCEEAWAHSTDYLYQNGKGMTDTSWVNGRPYWQNMGYIVEVDPIANKVIKKHYQMGKFVHEDVLCTADGKSVYMSDDMNPSVFFKFETETAFDYNKGNLFAYKLLNDGVNGEWIILPNDTASWLDIRNVALEKGASMFVRHEWLEEIDGKIYISETGDDEYNLTQSKEKGGSFTQYAIENLKIEGDGNFNDPYGRILEFDIAKNQMRPYLEGGMIDSLGCFSSPDCNTSVKIGGRTYLVLSEDLIGTEKGRSGDGKSGYYNEVYFLDMSIENPTVNDLMRFAVAPFGSETTGVIFTPDGKTMIMNIQHPSVSNPEPFNKSCTIIIEGFGQ
jgi:secreted PhoX family phosphatase